MPSRAGRVFVKLAEGSATELGWVRTVFRIALPIHVLVSMMALARHEYLKSVLFGFLSVYVLQRLRN